MKKFIYLILLILCCCDTSFKADIESKELILLDKCSNYGGVESFSVETYSLKNTINCSRSCNYVIKTVIKTVRCKDSTTFLNSKTYREYLEEHQKAYKSKIQK